MATEAPEVSTQWGHSIIIAGDPKKVTGSKRKSFMADMYGFKMDGELAGVLVTSDPTVDMKLSRYLHKFEYPRGCRPLGVTQSIAFGQLDK